MNRAVFLDRDGTIHFEKSYLSDPDHLELFPETLPSLRRLVQAGFVLFIVTNQSGIGRGYFSESKMHAVHRRLCSMAFESDVFFKQIYFAPEPPNVPSRGRKPSPQFLFDAQKDFDIELAASFMIGDQMSDLQCGWNAGVQQCLLVKTGFGKETARQKDANLRRASIVENLSEAADYILSH